MGTVTGFTSARMLAIENATIVDADVVGDNLIFERHDSTTFDAGNVRGAAGTNGTNGVNAPAVLAATTANVTQSGTMTVDGVSLVAGDRILCKDQTTAAQNGIWVVAAGAWARAADADTALENAGMIVRVQAGTVNGGTRWVTSFKSTDTTGTTAMVWARDLDEFNGVAGKWIAVSGTTDANGFLTVTHGLGFTPSFVQCINLQPSTNFPLQWGVDTIGATTFRLRFMNASTGGAAASIATGNQRALCLR